MYAHWGVRVFVDKAFHESAELFFYTSLVPCGEKEAEN